ncbi:MAG: hypothetical protein DI582_03895 [Azospirillum brasilense]|nr:MAG: hypothetical protein DI582_03895 [Azospirillum brasilense]
MYYVGFWRRLGAHFIDTMFMQFGMIIGAFFLGIIGGIALFATTPAPSSDTRTQVEPLAYQLAQTDAGIPAEPALSDEGYAEEDASQAPAEPVTNETGDMNEYPAESEFGPGVVDVPLPSEGATDAPEQPMTAGEAFMKGFREGMEESVDHTPEDDTDDLPPAVIGLIYLGAFLVSLIYHTAFVASRWQATPGKRLVGAKIVRASDGGRVGVLRAACRHITCFISWIPFGLLWIMVGVTREKTGLHDVICGTRVVFRTDVPWWNQQHVAVTQPPRNDAITGA